jgi:hypothetical protein
MIRKSLVVSVLALFVLSMTLMPAPVDASSGVSLSVSVSPTSVLAGEWAGVSGIVVNNTSSKLRTTVTFTAYDSCGTKTDLGYNRLALAPGQSVLITTAYPTKTSACRGDATVTMSMGGKGGTDSSVSATLQVL